MNATNIVPLRDGHSDMPPSEYFPSHYLIDFDLFTDNAKSSVSHGKAAACGMTLGRLFESGWRARFISPEDFLCCQYELNLLHQGIYTYFRDVYPHWVIQSHYFAHTRECKSGHGGFTSKPNSILHFARDPSYVPNAQPIELTGNRIREYTHFFFFDYLPAVFRGTYLPLRLCSYSIGRSQPIRPEELLQILKNDPDCREIAEYC